MWSGTCGPKLVGSPLYSRKFVTNSPVLSSLKPWPVHTLYKVASCTPAEKLVNQSSSFVGMNDRTAPSDGFKGERLNVCKPPLGHGLFAIFGARCFPNPTPLLSHNYARNNIWLSNSHIYSPRLLSQHSPVSIAEPLIVPPITSFEVPDKTDNRDESQNSIWLCKHDVCNTDSLHVSKSTSMQFSVDSVYEADPCGETANLDMEASAGSNNISEKKLSDHTHDLISDSSNDEILEGNIHEVCKVIHADTAVGSERYSNCDLKVKQHSSNELEACASLNTNPSSSVCSNSSQTSAPTIVDSDKAHLCVNDNFRLKKLLSDESGYYESASSDVPSSPCEWSKGLVLAFEDMEEYEWDEDETGWCYKVPLC